MIKSEPVKQANGKYKYRIRVKHPMTGEWREKSVTRKTKRECYAWEIEVRSDILNGINPDDVKILAFFDLWYETYKKDSVGRDHRNKINSTRASIEEFFGKDQTLKNIDKIKYQQWINYLGKKKNQAKATVIDKHKIFKAVLMEALDTGYIRANPCRNVTLVGRDTTSERKKALTLSEWKTLRDVLIASKEESASKYVCLTMMFLGLRFQEATGLCYSDLDMKNKVVRINKAFDYKETKELTRTKTAGSVRMVDMPDDLHAILSKYIALQRKNKVVSMKKAANDFLFTNEVGIPITNAAANKFLKKKCREAFIDEITTHAFRHSKTDLLVLAGSDMIYTQKQLGHSDPTTTLKYYSQLNNDIRLKNRTIQNNFLEANK